MLNMRKALCIILLVMLPAVLYAETAGDCYTRGEARAAKGDYAGAISEYTRAIALQPAYTEAYVNRGVAKTLKGDLRGALADLDTAVKLNPYYPLAYYNRGIAKQRNGDRAGAAEDYTKAIALKPAYTEAYLNRGVVKILANDTAGAIRDLDTAVTLGPKDALAYYNRGIAKQMRGDLDGSIADYTEAIRLNKNYAPAYYNRAGVKMQKGDERGADADYRKAEALGLKRPRSKIPDLRRSGVLKLTINEAVKVALRRSNLVKIASLEKEVGRGKAILNRSEAFPHLAVQAEYTEAENPNAASLLAAQPFQNLEHKRYGGDLVLTQPIYKGGKIPASFRIADKTEELYAQNFAVDMNDIVFRVKVNYYDVVLRKEIYTVTRESYNRALDHYRDVKRKLAQGMVSNFDEMRERVVLANTKSEMIRAKNSFEVAMVSFAKLLGLDPRRKLELLTSLAFTPKKKAYERELQGALRGREDLKALRSRIAIQESTITYVKANYWPQVSARGAVGWHGTEHDLYKHTDLDEHWSASVTVSFPIFDRLQTHGRLVQERARFAQLKLELDELKKDIAVEVKRILLQLENARSVVETQTENLKTAKEALRLSDVRYKQGLIKELHFNDMIVQVAVAKKNYNIAAFEYLSAMLRLDRAKGALYRKGKVK